MLAIVNNQSQTQSHCNLHASTCKLVTSLFKQRKRREGSRASALAKMKASPGFIQPSACCFVYVAEAFLCYDNCPFHLQLQSEHAAFTRFGV
eukprot:5375994-Pleurochrysis_carterae.AAC.2